MIKRLDGTNDGWLDSPKVNVHHYTIMDGFTFVRFSGKYDPPEGYILLATSEKERSDFTVTIRKWNPACSDCEYAALVDISGLPFCSPQ